MNDMTEPHEGTKFVQDTVVSQPLMTPSDSLSNQSRDVGPSSNEKAKNSLTTRGDYGEFEGTGTAGEDEYPIGLLLVLLAGASMMGVFLISLDQVRRSYCD